MDIIHIEYSSCEIGSTEHQKFKNIELHDAFKQLTFEELTAGSIIVLLKVR